MGTDIILFGWNRSVPGREQISGQHFQEFSAYLQAQQEKGLIDSFETVLLKPHGGDLNGFFLIKGEGANLDQLVSSKDWITHMTRGNLHLEGPGALRGVAGEKVMEWMSIWQDQIPA